jgi:hypothetical protein
MRVSVAADNGQGGIDGVYIMFWLLDVCKNLVTDDSAPQTTPSLSFHHMGNRRRRTLAPSPVTSLVAVTSLVVFS